MDTKDWLPFKAHDKRPYFKLTTEEKQLRHIESINRNIRFFSWIIIASLFGCALIGVGFFVTL